MRILFFFVSFLVAGVPALCQEDRHLDVERIIEEVFPLQEQDANYEELYEALLLHYSHPLDLNTASREELRSLFILTEAQVSSLLSYRVTYGKLLSIFELQAVPGLDLPTIQRLLPFVTVRETHLSTDNRSLIKKILSESNNYVLLRYERTLEEKKGFAPPDNDSDNRYAGMRGKFFARFRVSHPKDFSLGMTIEQDEGEPFTWDRETRRYGADFYSYHFQLQNRGRVKNLVLGDYQVQFGQSLVFGSGFNIGKGAESVATVRRTNLGARPYTSARETGFFRGGAATIEINKHLDMTAMYSRLKQDGIPRSGDDPRHGEYISSIQTSGLHRTQNEINARNTLTEENIGLNLTFQKGSWTTGTHALHTRYSLPIFRRPILANQFEFSGDYNLAYGLFTNYNFQNFTFFGEAARSSSGGIGAVAGLITALGRKLEAALVFRNYDRDFHSFYGDGFGEQSRNINERGHYWGLKYVANRKISFSCYFDSFAFGWLQSSASTPSTGYEYLVRFNYNWHKTSRFFFQYRRQSKYEDLDVDDHENNIKTPAEGIKDNFIFNLDHEISQRVSFKSRIQWSTFSLGQSNSSGFAAAQDLNIRYKKWRFSGRIALFDTDDFDNRQYIFERDVLYAFSIPALSGRGTRQYLLLQYRANRKLDFWLKYARTSARDRDVVGSGLEEIQGGKRTVIRFQTRIKI
ncbi:MAG: helix-hairpin-helix domain-containing protein [Cytophagales bacterium]|nr:helix-hairpin-helix domain-containing protein [Cytophagales bacterium]